MTFKHLLALSACCATSAAMAYPALGDRAEYVGTFTKGSKVVEVTKTLEIVGYKDNKNEWIVKETKTVGGRTKVDVDDEDAEDFHTATSIEALLKDCQAHGGTLADIEVPAGTFSTCMMSKAEGRNELEQTWYGDVPFGVVQKVEQKNRKKTVLQLQSFSHGSL